MNHPNVPDEPMNHPNVPDEVVAYYEHGFSEAERLTSPRGRLEVLRTQDLLGRLLPPAPARVLDVGGGPGLYARWLMDVGYDVYVVDPVAKHIEQCRQSGVSAALGDSRALDEDSNVWDAVLVMGPLYHLIDRGDRLQSLREAARVAKTGAPVVATAISRHAPLLDTLSRAALTPDGVEDQRHMLATGVYLPPPGGAFTTAFFHTPTELTDEMTEAALGSVRVLGIEGPGVWLLDDDFDTAEDEIVQAATAASLLQEDPYLIAASAHLLAVGRA